MENLFKRRAAASVRMRLFPAESPNTGMLLNPYVRLSELRDGGLLLFWRKDLAVSFTLCPNYLGACSMQVHSSFVLVVRVFSDLMGNGTRSGERVR